MFPEVRCTFCWNDITVLESVYKRRLLPPVLIANHVTILVKCPKQQDNYSSRGTKVYPAILDIESQPLKG